MNELDVEPVESIDERDVPTGVDAPEYVLYGGKGGVGKTTMAAATGLASARDGTRTLVVSTDPAHSLSDTFETEIPTDPERIRDDIPLFAAEIDPDAALEEGVGMFGEGGESPLGGLGDVLGQGDEGPMDALMGGAMPGADEAAAMQKLLELLDDDRFDRVVIDTAPTGHTLRLLELPEVMDTMVGRIVKLRNRFQGMMEGVKGMFGDGAAEGGTDDLDALRNRIERLRATLRDPDRTDFRVVMVPEEMSVFESKRLLTQLAEFEIPVGTVVVNKVMEDLADVVEPSAAADEAGKNDARAAVGSGAFVTPDLDDCEFCQRRWNVQQNALSEAQEVFRGHDIERVPLFADEVRGVEMLRLVAACLD